MLVDEYEYLEPDNAETAVTLTGYDALLSDRYEQLHEVARLYGRMVKTVKGDPDGAENRFTEHWNEYINAASTVHRVRYELAEYGKFPAGYEVTGDQW